MSITYGNSNQWSDGVITLKRTLAPKQADLLFVYEAELKAWVSALISLPVRA